MSQIDWKAQPGNGVRPGYFGEFVIIAGQLPDGVSTLTFKAIQTYSDGKQTAWIQVPAPGSSAVPEDPAPVLALAGARLGVSASTAPARVDGNATQKTASTGTATAGLVLGLLGAILGAAALALVILRGRRPSAP